MVNNAILGAIIPDTDKKKFTDWFERYLGRKPTYEEYVKWRNRVELFAKDVKEAGIPYMDWNFFNKQARGD